MEFLSAFLPILLYIAGLILLIALIVLVFKLIDTVDKVNEVVDNVEGKINSFNGALATINKAANGFASISDTVVFNVSNAISKFFNRKSKKKEDIYE